MEIKDILENLGYRLTQDSDGWRARPLYRDSGNNTSLKVYKTGYFCDFSAQIKGDLAALVKLTLGLKDISEARSWLNTKNFVIERREERPKIVMQQSWNRDILKNLIKNHSYWENRSITPKTLENFEGGIAISGAMSGRYVLPIFENENKIIGFTGRDITGNKPAKWKHIGSVKNWRFPGFLNRQFIQEKGEIIIVESPACVLKLWDCDIKNTICLFGTKISDSIICFLVGLNLNKIYISLNRDGNTNGQVGEKACEMAVNRLSSFFNPGVVEIKLPTKKDFAEMTSEEIFKWGNIK